MKIFEQFKNTNPSICDNKFVKVYKFVADGKDYKIIIPKKRANHHTIIHCVDNHIDWEQYPLLPRIWSGRLKDTKTIFKVEKPKNETVIFVIKGNPNGVTGLDDGIFRGVKKFDENYVNIMSYKKFKQL